ncbi:MAG: penicillin-binding protein 1A [Desulfomonilaceae bacterium]
MGSLFVWLGAGIPLLIICALASGFVGSFVGLYLAYSKDLPSIPDLRAYRPRTVSTFFADDGSVIGLFYREKRFPIDIGALPDHVVNAFLAAEDIRFFSHTGLDFHGIIRAIVQNVKEGAFSQGGSTITQQVTRNLLLTKEKKISRKVKEAILAYRIEKTLSKKEILGLYLNEIYLGKGSYGVESAAGSYFGKKAKDLNIAEAAFIAGLVANPSKFSQQKNLEAALKRKDVVLARMAKAGFLSDEEYQAAVQLPLHFREELPTPFEKAPYFTEAARQYVIARYGEDRLYNDGLQVWTTCDVTLQQAASEALLRGARAWERRQGRPRGLVKRLTADETRAFLTQPSPGTYSVGEVASAVVLDNQTAKVGRRKKTNIDSQECLVGMAGNDQRWISLPGGVLYRPHDLIRVRIVGLTEQGPQLELYDVPAVQGAVVCVENKSGYVKSLVGGLDFDASNFNRATQALRQPGSAFKPIVFAAGIQWAGLAPQTLVIDEPIAVITAANEPPWIPANSDLTFRGVMPLSQALAYSRNIAAVKVFMETGADQILQTARAMGITSRLRGNPSLSLGASEVTLLELTGAYTVFPNMGIKLAPVLIKRVVDRFGRVLEDNSHVAVDPAQLAQEEGPVSGPRATSYGPADRALGSSTSLERPGFINELRSMGRSDEGAASSIEELLQRSFPQQKFSRREPERVLSPMTAYSMVSMLKETCVNGTASAAAKLRRSDLAGKTGTTDDCTDAWFIGFNPTYTVGVWLGYDAKVSLGKKEYGSVAALPVWMDFMTKALQKEPVRDYPQPPQLLVAPEPLTAQGFAVWSPSDPTWQQGGYLDAKPAVSVDAPRLQSWWAWNAGASYGASWFFGQFASPSQSPYGDVYGGQTLRLLSPHGQDLGVGVLARDEKGRTTIMSLTEGYGGSGRWPQGWSGANEPYSFREAPHWEGPLPNNIQPPYQGIIR